MYYPTISIYICPIIHIQAKTIICVFIKCFHSLNYLKIQFDSVQFDNIINIERICVESAARWSNTHTWKNWEFCFAYFREEKKNTQAMHHKSFSKMSFEKCVWIFDNFTSSIYKWLIISMVASFFRFTFFICFVLEFVLHS